MNICGVSGGDIFTSKRRRHQTLFTQGRIHQPRRSASMVGRLPKRCLRRHARRKATIYFLDLDASRILVMSKKAAKVTTSLGIQSCAVSAVHCHAPYCRPRRCCLGPGKDASDTGGHDPLALRSPAPASRGTPSAITKNSQAPEEASQPRSEALLQRVADRALEKKDARQGRPHHRQEW